VARCSTSASTGSTPPTGPKIDGKLVGANAGVNSLAILANPAVFKKAGVDLPDDKTWTWDDYRQIAAEITAKGGSGVTGSSSSFGSDNLLQIWLRQNGKDTFSSSGLGFTADDLVPYLNMMVAFEKAKAIPSPSAINEEASKTLDQTSLAQGKQGMALYWSNQLAAVNDASGTTMKMLRPPTVAGDATKRNAWYKASMLWSASSRTKNPEAAGKLINWWVNNKACADICLDERGIPANPDMVTEITPKLSKDGKTAAKYIADIKPELGQSPVAPPPGGGTLGDVLNRHATDLLFGRASAQDAATKIVDELKSNLQS
jgi:multiple sugar transport system substrate-binding protein